MNLQEHKVDYEEDWLFVCVECGRELAAEEHNYGTPNLPVCIQCYFDTENRIINEELL